MIPTYLEFLYEDIVNLFLEIFMKQDKRLENLLLQTFPISQFDKLNQYIVNLYYVASVLILVDLNSVIGAGDSQGRCRCQLACDAGVN